ncbi:MAG: hypothetical protein A3B29_03730 [Candidatus Sungbacteria bacterium RIFCSPLOWO2_01_FULL_51_34]|uniref:Glycosyltransferase RgtA/B/C/D-like domain-containing protein n=1 Tax=Candidatus Sungbacteria bacterium RIFCSPHIGHO2_02_FULL_51_29 TaxID=1802273 RepID=A0A1G2KPK4_9BACT|nr:MAG: hypothetical protein A3C16_04680 [Candidatus Sungbacteria bacterium RIFCSPHIGHO2_02_FULL_51_29]OHA08032.1 MAG: hypothetical protein A3B29_03730 [Candidatus Sungbacteria bacterium RIFCSPLOWO2_01_FULL_51_34]
MGTYRLWVAIILFIMFIIMIASASGESAIMDELAHIPAGFSYVRHQDYRLNPEHPPLIKDLAALPLLFLRLNFPTDVPSWTTELNGQWTQGALFLYESGNNPDSILFWSRLPIMLLAVLFGWIVFAFTKNRFGNRAAFFALIFFAFSPTIIAHSRYVTTDLGAAFGFFIAITAFVLFLERPTLKNTLMVLAAFGVAQLLKFSLIIVLPVFLFVTGVWIVSLWRHHTNIGKSFSFALVTFGRVAFVLVASIIVVYPVYAFHVINYPATSLKADGTAYTTAELTAIVGLPEEIRYEALRQVPLSQKRDTVYTLGSFAQGPDREGITCDPQAKISLGRRMRCLAEFTIWASDKPAWRPLAQYLLGIEMVLQRAAGGNTTYFLGETSNGGWAYYFPVLYLLKEQLALHLLTLIALALALIQMLRGRKSIGSLRHWITENLFEFTALCFIVLYWAYSIRSPLNIGVRHVLPTFPFIYILVSRQIDRWLAPHARISAPASWREWLVGLYEIHLKRLPKLLLVAALLLWMMARTITTFPNYLSYFNELAGGNEHGYEFAVDSNYDWGQDLKRLANFVRARDIPTIAVDYFGGGSPRHYLGGRFEPWWSAKGRPHGYFAISATFRQGAWGTPAEGLTRSPDNDYEWLKPFRPVAKAGDSLFIYKLP